MNGCHCTLARRFREPLDVIVGKEGRDLDFAFKQGIFKGKEKSVKESEPGTLNPDAPEFTIHELPRATPGNAGLDLASSQDMIPSK